MSHLPKTASSKVRIRSVSSLAAGVVFGAAMLVALPAGANERHFTYTYESATLPAGEVELEPWTTVRTWKDDYYLYFDQRLEFELGLSDKLLGAFYLNFSGGAEKRAGTIEQSSEWQGVSTELKYKLLDPIADPLGLALYAETSFGPTEIELEGKLILDKRLDDVLLALNLVYAHEFERELTRSEYETQSELETDLGAAYMLSDTLGLGAEFRTHSDIASGEYQHSAFFAGPTLSWAQERYWLAASGLFQVAAVKGDSATGGNLELVQHEHFNGRLLLGFLL